MYSFPVQFTVKTPTFDGVSFSLNCIVATWKGEEAV